MATKTFDLKRFYLGLEPRERRTFARKAGTTERYLIAHLIGRSKIPRPALMAKIARACAAFGQNVDAGRLAAWFQQGAK